MIKTFEAGTKSQVPTTLPKFLNVIMSTLQLTQGMSQHYYSCLNTILYILNITINAMSFQT